jgi:hypothetical protein
MKIARTCRVTEDVELVKFWLTNRPEAWLLILDNADDPSLNILGNLPTGSRGTIIITTRNAEPTTLETVGSYEFAGMAHHEAATLLLKISRLEKKPQKEATKIASSIVETLGCLALAIIQAGATIRQKRCTIREYGEMYARCRKELLSRQHSPAITDYKYTVYTTWELSVSMIQSVEDETSRHSLDLLRVFSFMHFANISEEIFKRAWTNMKRYGWPPWIIAHQLSWLVDYSSPDWNPSLYRDALERLSSFSLITRNHANTISMHPLVHAWAKDRVGDAENNKWSAIAASTLASSLGMEFEYEDYSYRQSIISHISTWLYYFKTNPFSRVMVSRIG